MHANPMWTRIAAASLIMLLSGAALGETYYLTRIDVKTSAPMDPAIKVQASTAAIPSVTLSNNSDRPARCHMRFSTGSVPAGTSERTVAAHGRWVERTPVAGPAGIIDVLVRCA